MESTYVIKENWHGIIAQWSLLFAILSAAAGYGWLTARLAKKYGRRKFPHFVIGACVFIFVLMLSTRIEIFTFYVFRLELPGVIATSVALISATTFYLLFKRYLSTKNV